MAKLGTISIKTHTNSRHNSQNLPNHKKNSNKIEHAGTFTV